MITNCSHCTEEVDDEEIGMCETCEEDGLCPECLPHEFHSDDPERITAEHAKAQP